MAKKIQIEFDLNANDVKIVSDEVLTLAKQVRILKQELLKTEEGTQEFEILRNKLNDTKDDMERVNAKSREFFGTLQLIPGPIGEIASKLDGSISLLKVFSGFNFKDIKSSLTALIGDFGTIISNIGKATGVTKIYGVINQALSKSFVAIGVAEGAAAAGARAFSAALVSTGIGAIVVGLGSAINALWKWVSASGAAEKANEDFGESFEFLKRQIGSTQQAIQDDTKLRLLQAKLRRASNNELRQIEKEGLQSQIDATVKARERLFQESLNLQAGLGNLSKEDRKKRLKEISDEYVLQGQALTEFKAQQRIQNEQFKLDEQNEADAAAEKNKNKRKQESAEDLAARKANLDAAIQLEINSETTNRVTLEKLLEQRLDLENLSGTRLLLAKQDNAKKIEEAINEDAERERKKRQEDLDAKIQLEIDSDETNKERLKTLLDERMQLELDSAKLSESQKDVIRQKYAKQLEDALKEDSERRKQILIEGFNNELAAAEGNYEKQLMAYQNFADKIKNSIDLNEKEKNDLIKKGQSDIFKTITEGYQTQATKIEESYGEFKRFDQNYYQDQRNNIDETQKKLEQSRASGAITESQYTEQTAQLSKARKDIAKNEASARVETTAAIGNAFGQLSEIVGKDTLAGKAFAIAKTTIDTYLSAQQAFKAMAEIPVVGPALGAVAAAAAIVAGIKNVQKIVSVQVPPTPNTQTNQSSIESSAVNVVATRAQGGFVYGPGSSTSDSIPALLSNGEFVMNARSSSMFAPLLSSMNAVGNQPQFAMGGLAMSNTPGATLTNQMMETLNQFNARPIKTYVTATDMSSQQALDRTTKSRSLI